jgi:hypothetical protein
MVAISRAVRGNRDLAARDRAVVICLVFQLSC